MTNKNLMKKIAPVVMSAAVVMSNTPYAVLASDFTDSEVITDNTDISAPEEFTTEKEQDEFTTEDAEEDAFSAETQQGEAYVLMNIPYDDFYKAELKNNDVKVDAFTSATLNKSRTSGMMNGNSAYHVNPDGSDVTGVTFPVKVSDLSILKDQKQVTDSDSVTITVTNKGQTSSNTYTGKDSLIENASYSYYVLSEAPSYYKELTVNADGSYSFSAMKGAEIKTLSINATLKTETKYGDYELDLDNNAFPEVINTNTDKIYGVTVNTTDGTNYGLRHLGNIWRGSKLAWGTGYTTEVHGCPVSSAHYKSIMGKTIDSVTYYTDKGIITFDVPDVKVQITTGIKATVVDIMDTDSSAAVTFDQTLPADFNAQYTVDGTEVSCADGKLAVGALALGTHKVVITDTNGIYVPITAEFTVNTDKMPAAYDSKAAKLVAADGATADELSAYIKNISKVKVDDKEYAASGRGAKVIIKEDGTLDLTDLQVTDTTVFEVTSVGYKNNLVFTYKEAEAYVLMNIPYDDFYKAELKNNDVKVDAFTSATLNKSRTSGMMNGNSAYHVNPDGSDVTGVTFPVKVSDLSILKDQKQVTDSDSVTITVTNRGQTSSNTYTGKDSLIENASYSYYVLSEAPSYYKELTVNTDGSYSFSAMKGAETKTVSINATLKTETSYGDYELDLDNNAFPEVIDTNTDKIYGVTVNTTDGTNYGLRHLENIWRGSMLAWGTGYTTEVHGCPVSSAHYKSIMGKTIDSVTYYTDKGIITFDVPDVKVQTTTGIKATVADIMDTDSSATVTFDQTLPADFNAQYTVDGTEVSCADGKLAVGALALGTHKVVITDTNGIYVPITAEFTVNTDKMPAAYDSKAAKLVAADGATADELSAYIKNISKVKVDDKEYAASGRGAKVIIKEDGTLDLTDLQVTDTTVFEVTSVGYKNNLVFTYKEAENKFELNTTAKTLYTEGQTKVSLKLTTNLTDKIIWKSSNTKVATVNSAGVVTARAKGTAVITASCGKYTATCTITVKNPSLTLNKKSTTLYKGTRTTLKAYVKGVDASKVTFTSNNTKVVVVNKTTGRIVAKAAGKAVITVKCGSLKTTCTVTVKNPTLKLAKTSASIKVGKKTTIKATAAPSGTIKYTSSNKKIVTVSSKGVVTGKKKGTAKITVTCNGVSKTFKVTVK
nr:Ig-like domain-containing protein [uncultured Blautia sp.]